MPTLRAIYRQGNSLSAFSALAVVSAAACPYAAVAAVWCSFAAIAGTTAATAAASAAARTLDPFFTPKLVAQLSCLQAQANMVQSSKISLGKQSSA